MQSYEWLFVPWLVYHFIYAALMILSPTIITYIGYAALTNDSNDKYKVLLGLVPITIGLLSIYLWIHVKMLFDQLCKAVNTVKPSAPPLPPAKNDNLTINVVAPYPPYDRNYSVYDGAGGGHVSNPVFHQNSAGMPSTPQVLPQTPIKKVV